MFSTDYNRKIAEQVNKINQDFIKHSKRVNRSGGGLLNIAEVDKTALGRPVGGSRDLPDDDLEGGNIFKDIFHGIKSIFGGNIPEELLNDVEGGRKKKYVKKNLKKGKGIYETDDLMEKPEGGRKKKGKKGGVAPPEVVEGGKKKRGKKGGNFLDDLVDDVGKVAPILPLIALGKPKKAVKKGGVLGIKAPSTFYSDKVSNNPFKGGKKTSKWIEHVKKFARDNKLKYNEALKDPKCKASYKSKK